VFPLKKVGFALASSWHANLVGVTELVERVSPKVAQKRTYYSRFTCASASPGKTRAGRRAGSCNPPHGGLSAFNIL
jgi:hypothetical protein